MPRRFAPRNDMQKIAACPHSTRVLPESALAPKTRIRLQHVLARRLVAKRTLGKFSACHCEPVRTLVWQSASPQEQETVYSTLGKFAALFVFALSATLCYVLPQEKRIATSLRSSQ